MSLELTCRKREKKQCKVEKHDRRATKCATETLATIVLGIKVQTLWRFHLTLVFYVFQLYGVKVVKIDFSNNQIGEIKKKMTFQGVFMYK